MAREFKNWLADFRDSIADYKYYTNFPKVFGNVNSVRVELNILNTLIGSADIEKEFDNLLCKYPEVLKCIPLLLAKRETEIKVTDETGSLCYDFANRNYDATQYKIFMRETGLFDLLENHIVNNLVDYVTGVEVGLDSNARKNRGGHLMEDLVEKYLQKSGLVRGITYFKEMNLSQIQERWNINLSCVSNNGTTEKRFDFVVKTPNKVYGIETNFYSSGGSKLNETARSYKTIATETRNHPYFKFVWITDGVGWKSAQHNLKETFDVLPHLYNINDLERGVFDAVFE